MNELTVYKIIIAVLLLLIWIMVFVIFFLRKDRSGLLKTLKEIETITINLWLNLGRMDTRKTAGDRLAQLENLTRGECSKLIVIIKNGTLKNPLKNENEISNPVGGNGKKI